MGCKVSKHLKKNKYNKIKDLEILNESVKNLELYQKEKKKELEKLEDYGHILKDELKKYKYLLKSVLNQNEELNELHEIKSRIECKICMDRTINTYLIPCGHVICNECILNNECPFCRAKICEKRVLFLN